jgi:uncharacterized protein YpiB (UPF0302 family)
VFGEKVIKNAEVNKHMKRLNKTKCFVTHKPHKRPTIFFKQNQLFRIVHNDTFKHFCINYEYTIFIKITGKEKSVCINYTKQSEQL